MRAPARIAVAPDVVEALREMRAEQARQGEVLAAILRALERGRGPRDEADRAALLAIREAVADRSFTAAGLMRQAEFDPTLQDALLAADLAEARDVGTFFRRIQGVLVGGLRVERRGDHRLGALWSVTVRL